MRLQKKRHGEANTLDGVDLKPWSIRQKHACKTSVFATPMYEVFWSIWTTCRVNSCRVERSFVRSF